MKLTKPLHRQRRLLFKFAVGANGRTLKDWCAAQDITQTHLNYIMRGIRHSTRIDLEIYKAILANSGPTLAAPFKPEAL